MYYTVAMNATITIRLDEQRREELHQMAVTLGKTDSQLVREFIERGLVEESLGHRLARLKGSISQIPSTGDALSQSIRARNWRS